MDDVAEQLNVANEMTDLISTPIGNGTAQSTIYFDFNKIDSFLFFCFACGQQIELCVCVCFFDANQ